MPKMNESQVGVSLILKNKTLVDRDCNASIGPEEADRSGCRKRRYERSRELPYHSISRLRARRGIFSAASRFAGRRGVPKILDHRGIVLNFPLGALAHLGLARAYAMQDDTGKAKAACQDFLTLWKGADADIPILKQAKVEYAKLQ